MTGTVLYQLLANGSAHLSGDRLAAFQTLNPLLGTKVEPMRLHQREDFPAVLYEMYSADPSDVKNGPSALDQDFFRLTCYGNTYDEAHQVMAPVRTVLDRFSGTVSGIKIQSIQYLSARDLFDDAGQKAGVQHDYKIRVAR
jgi:hypothetical protein